MDNTTPTMIIGLHSERPRSGKSTVAKALADANGGKVYSIAGGIRTEARDLGFEVAADAVGDAKDVPHPALGGRTPREVLILIGEARTHRYGQQYWVKRTLADIAADFPDGGFAVVDDVRRLEEGEELIEAGGTVCTIVRQGVADVVDINGWRSRPQWTFDNDKAPAECADRIWARACRDRRAVS